MQNRSSELSARAAAALAITGVLSRGESLRAAFSALDARVAEPRDRGLLRELAFGVLRFLPSLRAEVKAKFARPLKSADAPLEALLLIGLYQLKRATQPSYAIVHATTECTRELGFARASGFINAVLRGLQRDGVGELALSGERDHPRWLIEVIEKDWPAERDAILAANMAQAPMWLRVNARRLSRAAYAEQLDAAPEFNLQAACALKLAAAVGVDQLPGFSAGQASVQDLSAQLAAPLLDARAGMRVLDACAAPGGKTAHLQEAADNQLDLTALDSDSTRLRQVAETLERLGLSAKLECADARDVASWYDGRPFDRILLDAPCSGFGVIRRHPDIKVLRRPTDVAAQVVLQRELLDALWPLLKPGGLFLYATCSIQTAENAGQIKDFLKRYRDAELQRLPAIGVDTGFGVQRLPGLDDGDGFFYALLAKRA